MGVTLTLVFTDIRTISISISNLRQTTPNMHTHEAEEMHTNWGSDTTDSDRMLKNALIK